MSFSLKNLMVDAKTAWIDFPGMEGFQVKLAALSRETLMTLRKSCMHTTFDRKYRTPKEELDEKKFIRKFTDASIKDWKGLKLAYIEQLMVIDAKGQDLEAELDYDQEHAYLLVSNSTVFDEWLNEAVFDLDNFRTRAEGVPVESAGSLAE